MSPLRERSCYDFLVSGVDVVSLLVFEQLLATLPIPGAGHAIMKISRRSERQAIPSIGLGSGIKHPLGMRWRPCSTMSLRSTNMGQVDIPEIAADAVRVVHPQAFALSMAKLAFIIVVLSLNLIIPARAELNITLGAGRGFPVCVAIVEAMRRLPPPTGLMTWPAELPPIRGVTRPQWKRLDPRKYIDAIRSFEIQNRHQWHSDLRSDEDIWTQIGPMTGDAVRAGRIELEEAVVPNVQIASAYNDQALTTDIIFQRIGSRQSSFGTLIDPNSSVPGPAFISWAFMAASFSRFPKLHNVLVDAGRGEHEMILVAGQPWFIILPAMIGIPRASHLDPAETDVAPVISVSQDCWIRIKKPSY